MRAMARRVTRNMRFEKISLQQFQKDFHQTKAQYDDIRLPERATLNSAGYDFFAPYSFSLSPGHTIKIPTGVRAILDDDKFLMVVPRSSLGFRYRLRLDNTVGIIDADYAGSTNEGHIWIQITNEGNHYSQMTPSSTLLIRKGDAIAQGIILPYFKVEDDNATSVRDGGIGSTSMGYQGGDQ